MSSSVSRKHGSVESHTRRQPAEHLGIGQRLAERRDRRIVRERVEVAVRLWTSSLLELRRRGQQDVGVVGGVGLEDLVHDAEQVVAREAAPRPSLDSGATATGFEL